MINKNPLFFSFAFNIFWVTLLVFYVYPIYNTTDDVQLEWILSGTLIMDSPNADVYFIHIFFSKFLATLYIICKGFNWYGFAQIFLITLSAATLNFLLLKQFKESIWLKIFSSTILFLFLSNIIVRVQFTQTSQIATFTGYAILMFSNRNIKMLIFASLFLSIGLMMRWEGFIIASFIVIPSLFFSLYFSNEKLVYAIKIIVLPLIIPLLLKVYHEQYYDNKAGWHEHLAFHKEHVLLFDYIYLDRLTPENTKQIFKQSGWNNNDWNMLSNFFIEDDSIFSTNKMKRLTIGNNYIDYFNNKNLERLKRVAQMYVVPYSLHLLFIALCFVIIPSIVAKKYDNIFKYLLQGHLWVLLFFCIVVLFFRMPALRYIMIPLFFPAYCAMFFNTSIVISFFSKSKLIPIFTAIFFIALIGVKLSAFQFERNKHLGYQKDFKDEIAFLKRYEDNFLVLFDWGTPHAAKGLFTSNKDYNDITAWYAGNDLRSPTIRNRLKRLGIDKITTALPNNKNMLLVTCKTCKNNTLFPYIKFMKQYYNKEIAYKLVGEYKSLSLYQLNYKN